MNVFAKFDEIPEVIKETKRYGHTDGRSVARSDNVKTVYPPTNTVCGGYNDFFNNQCRETYRISYLICKKVFYFSR